MRTFLQRDWRTQPHGEGQSEGAGQLRGVPLSFVTGVFLPSLIREHHYRGGGAEAEVVDVQVGGTRAVAPAFRRVPAESAAALRLGLLLVAARHVVAQNQLC